MNDSAVSLPAGPEITDESFYSPDELVIRARPEVDGLDRTQAVGGTVVQTDDALGLAVVKFPVDSFAELIVIRDELRAGGVDAAAHVVEDDPTADG